MITKTATNEGSQGHAIGMLISASAFRSIQPSVLTLGLDPAQNERHPVLYIQQFGVSYY
jgi:hypothetical protein